MNWEYKTVKLQATGVLLGGKVDQAQLDLKINELGAQGWELCTALSAAMFSGPTRDMVLIFKRPKS